MISLYVIYPYIITPIAPTHILTLSLHDALPISQGMRNFSIALLAVPIPYTTNPGHIGIAFKGLGLPDKFAYAIDLSFRFLPTVARDFGTTLDAQRARGFEIDKLQGGIFSKIARLAPMVVPVVIGAVVVAEDIINALDLC